MHNWKGNSCIKECRICKEKIIIDDWVEVNKCLRVCKKCGKVEVHHKMDVYEGEEYVEYLNDYAERYKCSSCNWTLFHSGNSDYVSDTFQISDDELKGFLNSSMELSFLSTQNRAGGPGHKLLLHNKGNGKLIREIKAVK